MDMDLTWMAWTWPTATFFISIFLVLAVMTLWSVLKPSGSRPGILGIATTRGDRLFVSLLGSAYIHLAWLALAGPELWWASALSVIYTLAVFRWV